MRDQTTHAQARLFLPAQQDAIGAIVRDQQRLTGQLSTGQLRIPLLHGGDHAHNFAGRGVFHPDHFYRIADRIIHAFHDLLDPVDVGGAIGNDQRVVRGIRRQMTLLWNQRPQDGYELRGRNTIDVDDARDQLVALAAVGKLRGTLFGGNIRYDLDDLADWYGGVTVHLQHRQQDLIDLVLVHRLGGNHRDLRLDSGV